MKIKEAEELIASAQLLYNDLQVLDHYNQGGQLDEALRTAKCSTRCWTDLSAGLRLIVAKHNMCLQRQIDDVEIEGI